MGRESILDELSSAVRTTSSPSPKAIPSTVDRSGSCSAKTRSNSSKVASLSPIQMASMSGARTDGPC